VELHALVIMGNLLKIFEKFALISACFYAKVEGNDAHN